MRGRCTRTDAHSIDLLNEEGNFSIACDNPGEAALGDIVEVAHKRVQVLTPNRSNGSHLWARRILDPRRQKACSTRLQTEASVRQFFGDRGFLETHTPLLVQCPGMEPHIRPFRVFTDRADRPIFLPTSPEFAMKRLLVGGLEKIFQISPAFRREPESVTHHPAFTMLEWYRAYAGYEDIMRDTEDLFSAIATRIHGKPSILFQGKEISLAPPWPRLRVRDLFQDHAGVDLVRCSTPEALLQECRRLGLSISSQDLDWDTLYFNIWLNCIEPRLPSDRAVFVTRYPASQAALAVLDIDPDGSHWAKRFEVYAGGLELGNAFEELTDPIEQRARFEKDMNLRTQIYGDSFPKTPIDEEFLQALAEGMPPSGGIAIGLDRIVMLMADEPVIEKTFWLPSVQ